MAKAKSKDKEFTLPEFTMLKLAYEQLDPGKGNVLVATILCERQGCGNVFKVDWEVWSQPHQSQIRGWEIFSRPCTYCFAARRPPRRNSGQVQVLHHSQPELRHGGGR